MTHPPQPTPYSLDPTDWDEPRRVGHAMLDGMLDHLESLRDRPLWQPMPAAVRARLRAPWPKGPTPLSELYELFKADVLPYTLGNTHPGFMGWVHGGGTVVGMLAELLAAGVNANLGGRDHAPIEVERQVVGWVRALLGFPETASGLFMTGTSIATFSAVVVARTARLGVEVRQAGLGGAKLVSYAAQGAHGSIARAFDFAGLGTGSLRAVATDGLGRMDPVALAAAVVADRTAGHTPFMLVGTAGSVDIGAIDPLTTLADLARQEGLWFHVDGAYGALGMLAPEVAPRLEGIERADSVALDFHKWGQVPYDAGFLLVRDGRLQQEAFGAKAGYLHREDSGMAAGSPWPCDLGPDLSRGFRALKAWFTLRAYGEEALGRQIAGTCSLARYLQARVEAEPELELLAPAQLNIVCFRYRAADPDALNAAIVVGLQAAGRVAPSTTHLPAGLAIRAAIVNHRTTALDIDALVDGTLAQGRAQGARP